MLGALLMAATINVSAGEPSAPQDVFSKDLENDITTMVHIEIEDMKCGLFRELKASNKAMIEQMSKQKGDSFIISHYAD
jgi:hypothetical protein